jgi:hypothetical protein
MRAMVLAAGKKGTRLFPLSGEIPKETEPRGEIAGCTTDLPRPKFPPSGAELITSTI